MVNTLELVLALLAGAVLVVGIFRSLNLPPVLGYLMVGAAVGPHAMNLMPDTGGARYLAEFGVVFLMFTIGLEFSLPRLYSMKRIVFGLGATQVLASVVLVARNHHYLAVQRREQVDANADGIPDVYQTGNTET